MSMTFENLDLNRWYCFGIEHPKENSWVNQSIRSRTLGWNMIDINKFEASLAINVDSSYICLAQFYLTDLDDDVKYRCYFDNQKALWNVEVLDSPKAEIDMESKEQFFQSEMMKKIAMRSADIIERAKKEYYSNIQQKLRSGNFLKVDEEKLSELLTIINQQFIFDNMRKCAFMK